MRRWTTSGLVVLAVTVLGCSSLAAQDQPADTSDLPTSIDDLFVRFGVEGQPADFVVVVDTSSSMSAGANPPYPRVLDAYRSLVDSIPDGDNLSVVTFDSTPELAFQNPLSSGNRDEARDALPSSADGDATDIGAGLDATLRRLERADASDSQLVIFLTDGAHAPASGSAYPTTSGPAWDELRTRADAVDADHDLLVEGVALGDQGAGGVGLLRQVFGNPEVNSLPSDQLPDFFRESVRRSQLGRLQRLVNDELDRGVRVVRTQEAELSEDMEVEVGIQSNLETLPVDVAVTGVRVTDGDGETVDAELVGPDTVRIEPGQTAGVRVLWPTGVSGTGFEVPPATDEATYHVNLDATYQVLPRDLLSRVTSKPTTAEVAGRQRVNASRTYGYTLGRLLLMMILLVLALLFALWAYRRFLQVPALVGVFVLDKAVSEEKSVIELKGKHQRLTAKDVPGAGAAKIDLYTKRGKRKRVFAQVENGPFWKVEDRRKETPVIEDTEIRLGRYRLGGGRMKYQPKAPVRD